MARIFRTETGSMAVDVFLQRKDISEESKRKLFVDNTRAFTDSRFRTCLNSVGTG